MQIPDHPRHVEWPTLGIAALAYGLWAVALFAALPLIAAVPVAAVAIALHSSLCHETIHGHPFRHEALNAALVWPALAVFIPYARFRDTHLAHHRDERLTDPYDDPETNYLAPADWDRSRPAMRLLRRANNTLAGRVVLGPILSQIAFMQSDWRLARGDEGPDIARSVWRAWLGHLPAAAAVLGVVRLSPVPIWAYLVAAWAGLGLIKIRTFLEHRAEAVVGARTVIIEDRGPLSFLFLNNNLHAVHHARPGVPWYRLPQVYRADPQRFLGANGGYRYASYGAILRQFLWRTKDPVAHPLYRR